MRNQLVCRCKSKRLALNAKTVACAKLDAEISSVDHMSLCCEWQDLKLFIYKESEICYEMKCDMHHKKVLSILFVVSLFNLSNT